VDVAEGCTHSPLAGIDLRVACQRQQEPAAIDEGVGNRQGKFFLRASERVRAAAHVEPPIGASVDDEIAQQS
jgi:hypothetical protein